MTWTMSLYNLSLCQEEGELHASLYVMCLIHQGVDTMAGQSS
jgi:hypothetical protein